MNLLKYVDIDIGTDSEYRESNGNTLPNVQYPFGNQAFVFQSNKSRGGWFYKPNAHYTEGIRVTNQPSPWLGDYGHITILPYNGDYNIDLHTTLMNKYHYPNKMGCTLKRYNIEMELVPTKNGAVVQVRDLTKKQTKILIDCHQENVKIKSNNSEIIITSTNIPKGKFSNNFRKFYCLKFSCEIVYVNKWENGSQLEIILNDNDYRIDLISSYISIDLCKQNANRQSNQSYAKLSKQVEKEWNMYLSTVEIESSVSDETLEVFYSNLYRTLCFPRFINEQDENGNEVYYNFKNQTIDKGLMISDVGFWDLYRTTIPLHELLIPKIYKKTTTAILNYYISYGWLPRWLSPYERGVMPSTLVDSVVSRAITTNVYTDEQKKIAIEALLKNGNEFSNDKLFGREYLDEYLEYGYVPSCCDGETVSISLDNYYCDYSIYKALKSVNHELTCRFHDRCQEYTKLFNKKTKLFEPCDKDGNFSSKFSPIEWGFDFCESSAYQNNLNIFHDVDGIIKLMGGSKKVEERLDFLFDADTKYSVGRYGFEIHEMTEFAKISDLGYFAISNQPSFNLPFWYLHIGCEEKFSNIINKTHKYFTNKLDGYPGDEDNGSLSAWFVLTCLGTYPFCPVDGFISFKSSFKYKINKI